MLERFLPSNPRLRTAVVSVLALGVLLIVTQFVFPGGGGGGRGTPGAVLFSALVQGMLSALTAAGIVLIYRTSRIINFAQTAIGAAGGELAFQLMQLDRVPFLISFALGLVTSVAIGALVEVAIIRRFSRSPRLVVTVATIAVALLLGGIANQAINQLPFFPKDRSFDQTYGLVSIRPLMPFAGFHFQVGGLHSKFGFPDLFAIELSALALLGIAAFFRFTRAGVAVRAIAENTERAELLGISTGKLSLTVWSLAGLLSGIGVILLGSLTTPGSAAGVAPGVLLPALAASVVARMRSLPVVVGTAIAISVLTGAAQWSFPHDTPLISVGLLLVISLGLLLQRGGAGRSEESGGVTWEATEEQRPVPKELRDIGGLRMLRYGLAVVGLGGLILYPFLLSTGLTVIGATIAVTGLVGLSLVVLTGWAGQVSLGQFGLAAIGAVVGGALNYTVGLPFWLAVPLAGVVTGAAAILIGLPALRIKGLYLAVTTLAFAFAIEQTLFSKRYFGWLLPRQVDRPRLFFLNFEEERSMYFLCVFVLLLGIVAIYNLRRSRFGRTLIALRENEANVQSFGVAAIRTKLQAFAVSGIFAGVAGAMLAIELRGVSAISFTADQSLTYFVLAVLGGISSSAGVLIGVAYFALTHYFFPTNIIVQSLAPFLVLIILFIAPGGLISLVNQVRDGILRIIAQRRQIVVPSLFADYDPEALERRLIPLSEPSAAGTLAALNIDERYALESELYVGRGERVVEKMQPAKPTKEAAAILAASEGTQA
jgi:branched-chain amino acid transport system permease protein